MDVIMAIKPEWCKKIITGEKTLEIRKTIPDFVRYPFKVYVYATRGGENWFIDGKQMSQYVIGEFTCKDIASYSIPYPAQKEKTNLELLRRSYVPYEKLYKYADGDNLYGWDISDFVLYPEPLPISNFASYTRIGPLKRPPQSWQYAYKRDM